MTRDTALELMDALAAQGYRVNVRALPQPVGFFAARVGDESINYSVEVTELGVDRVDLRALIAIADEHGVDCGAHMSGGGVIAFFDLDPRPRVVRTGRQHPRPPVA